MDSRLYKPIQTISAAFKRERDQQPSSSAFTQEDFPPLRPRASTAPEIRGPDPRWAGIRRFSFLLNFTTKDREISREQKPQPPEIRPPYERKPSSEIRTSLERRPEVKENRTSLSFLYSASSEEPSILERVRSASMSSFFTKGKADKDGNDSSTGRDAASVASNPKHNEKPPFIAPKRNEKPPFIAPVKTPEADPSFVQVVNLSPFPDLVEIGSQNSPIAKVSNEPHYFPLISLKGKDCPASVQDPCRYPSSTAKESQVNEVESQLIDLKLECINWLTEVESTMKLLSFSN
jgi:hypothetical protein